MSKLNKRDLIEEVSEKTHISKKHAESSIETAFDLIQKALLDGREVNITNFGTFTPMTKESRDGTDPKKHTRITIQQTQTVSFKLSKSLKAKLNK